MTEDAAPIYEDWECEMMWDDYCRELYYANTLADMEPIELPEADCPF